MTTTPDTVQVVLPEPGVAADPPPRRQWPYLLATFLVLALVGGAAFVAYRTPVLGVRQVAVVPATGDLSPEAEAVVRAAVNVPDGTPLIGIDLAAVRRQVLSVPQIAGAAVSRRWPGELLITVTQRTPVAVTRANGALWLLDATGLPYLKVDPAVPPASLLTVALATPGPADPATMAALAVIAELPASIRATVSSVSARSPYGVTLDLLDSRTVVWGSPDAGARKAQILPAVLAQPGKTFDISDPDYVTVTG